MNGGGGILKRKERIESWSFMYIRKRVKRKKRIKSKKINRNVDFYDVLFDVLFSIYIVG